MKTKKVILNYVVLPLVILLVVLVVAFFLVGNSLIKTGIEVAATQTLGVPVTVKSINLSILRGRVAINGLVVKNPPGYDPNETLLELGNGVVNLDISSLMSNTIKIQLVKLDNTKLTIEQKGLTNNLNEIVNKLPKKEEQKEPAPKTEKAGKNIIVTKLEITGTNVRVKSPLTPAISLKLDPIVMENLGTDSKLSVATLVGKVMGALAVGVTKQVAGSTAELGKSAAKEGQKALEKTTDAGKGAVEGIKGLFGGKKTEPNK